MVPNIVDLTAKIFAINIFPNPTIGKEITFLLPDNSGSLSIYSIQGRFIKKIPITCNGIIVENTFEKGTYIVKYANADNTASAATNI